MPLASDALNPNRVWPHRLLEPVVLPYPAPVSFTGLLPLRSLSWPPAMASTVACAASPGVASFSEAVKRSFSSAPPLPVVHEAPLLNILVNQDALDHAEHYRSHALVCRFNGLWPRLSDLHSWVSSKLFPLLKECAIICPCAKVFL